MNGSHRSGLERDFVGYGRRPPDPRWPGGARLALNFVVNYEEGSEESIPDGDAASETGLTEGATGGISGRDLGAESMFEYGSRVGVWRLFRLLRERGCPATVFACALALERNAEVAATIREYDYDVCGHGWRWIRHPNLRPEEEREQIARAVRSIATTTGMPPAGWYCRYAPSPQTRRILVEHGGFLYDSDSYGDELPYWVEIDGKRHLVVPYSLTNNDTKFMRAGMATAGQYFEFLRDAFDMLYREGATQPKMMSVGLHCRIAGHPARAAGLERFLDHVARYAGVWLCRRVDIARHWHAEHGAG
jgi:peptidoglycan/xylan/chitin deacetylase (PgdA/CDA1 family)